jgi:aspartate carbamoyltransferase catalytic subunit
MTTDELIDPSRQTHLRLAEKETTLTTGSNEARARAEASFRKEERAKDAAKAMMEYQANARIVREKTERLKALRLAKETVDKERAG